MARKKQPQRHWLRTLFFLIAIPLAVWAGAFLLWLYWDDASRWLGKEAPQQTPRATRPTRKEESPQRPVPERPQEKITDDDRRKLEDILKRRN